MRLGTTSRQSTNLSPRRLHYLRRNLVTRRTASFTNSLGMDFVLVRGGRFPMGGGKGKLGDSEVEISTFYLGKYEITQEQWQRLTKENPSFFRRGGRGDAAVKDVPDSELKQFPVEMVSWTDAKNFIRLLNNRDRVNGWFYRLPKIAEWEYACRGGLSADPQNYSFDFYLDKPMNSLSPGTANFDAPADSGRTCKVGSYLPNSLGLYDMHGNVAEWCDQFFKKDVPATDRHSLLGEAVGKTRPLAAGRPAGATGRTSEHLNSYGLRLALVRPE